MWHSRVRCRHTWCVAQETLFRSLTAVVTNEAQCIRRIQSSKYMVFSVHLSECTSSKPWKSIQNPPFGITAPLTQLVATNATHTFLPAPTAARVCKFDTLHAVANPKLKHTADRNPNHDRAHVFLARRMRRLAPPVAISLGCTQDCMGEYGRTRCRASMSVQVGRMRQAADVGRGPTADAGTSGC